MILLTDYLLFLTQWSPEKAAETKKFSAGSFVKYLVKEGVGELTWGVSDLVIGVGKALKSATAIELLGKNAEEMLANPWSLIIPLKDITSYDFFKANLLTRYLHLHVNHRFEGAFDVSITPYAGPDSLFKNLKKLMQK